MHFGQPNEIKVLVKNGVPSGRWYNGGGIYRGVNLTPNGDTPITMFADLGFVGGEPTTWKRCEKIREVAQEENVCLADARAVWDAVKEKGCAWEELLANKVNHSSVEGHEVYARVLMKLFE